MPTLREILESQHRGIRQNSYKYKIVCIMNLYDARLGDDETVAKFRDGKIYLNIEDIPEIYYDHTVYNIEPDIDAETKCLYLRIVII